MSPIRKYQLTILRNRLNQMGDWYYANEYGSNGFVLFLDRSPEWNKRRVKLRNRITARLEGRK